MRVLKGVLRVVSVMLLLGGAVRLFAGRKLFGVFGMQALWTDHAYFNYVYKVLGAFVILAGLGLHTISRDPEKYSELSRVFSAGFALTGVVMLAAGVMVRLPVEFYVPDFIFCFALAAFLHVIRIKAERS
jgi:hypothetical protein